MASEKKTYVRPFVRWVWRISLGARPLTALLLDEKLGHQGDGLHEAGPSRKK
jgi:hypothetical protein